MEQIAGEKSGALRRSGRRSAASLPQPSRARETAENDAPAAERQVSMASFPSSSLGTCVSAKFRFVSVDAKQSAKQSFEGQVHSQAGAWERGDARCDGRANCWRASISATGGVFFAAVSRGSWRLPESAAMIWADEQELLCDRAVPAARSTPRALAPRTINSCRELDRSSSLLPSEIRSPSGRRAQSIASRGCRDCRTPSSSLPRSAKFP
jgi:hypothetical protein